MVGLGDLPGGNISSFANGVSADGSVVVGGGFSASGTEAFRWTSGGGMVGLGDLPGGSFSSQAVGVSADGSVVVGAGSSASGTEAFRWTSGGGMVGLGDLPGGAFNSIARAVSADGSVVVGQGFSVPAGRAFIWDPVNGMRALDMVLVDSGIDLTGWTLIDATGISDDGLTIVGMGFNPSRFLEGWIAVIPEPSTAALLGIGLLSLGYSRRRS
jgi:probable HAF family extracellular repeat protein